MILIRIVSTDEFGISDAANMSTVALQICLKY